MTAYIDISYLKFTRKKLMAIGIAVCFLVITTFDLVGYLGVFSKYELIVGKVQDRYKGIFTTTIEYSYSVDGQEYSESAYVLIPGKLNIGENTNIRLSKRVKQSFPEEIYFPNLAIAFFFESFTFGLLLWAIIRATRDHLLYRKSK